jgi:hypothetical protein
VVELRPLEVQTFYIQSTQFAGEEGQAHLGTLAPEVSSIENEYLRVYLDPQTNRYAAQFPHCHSFVAASRVLLT